MLFSIAPKHQEFQSHTKYRTLNTTVTTNSLMLTTLFELYMPHSQFQYSNNPPLSLSNTIITYRRSPIII